MSKRLQSADLALAATHRHHDGMKTGSVRLDRHARHILLKEIGGPGQTRLAGATVAMIGVGGLGAPAALYLAAAGVGRIILIDPDVVELTNLQRQILFRTEDVGVDKARAGQTNLQALDPAIGVEALVQRLDATNAERLIAGADIVLDGSDNFETRFAVNAACHALAIPLVSGAVGRWDGQVGLFASGISKSYPHGPVWPCYRCFIPHIPPDAESCAQLGIVGALTGIIGSMMALEAIKWITRAGSPLVGKIWIMDGLSGSSRTIVLEADPACSCCGVR
ncbi:HesA/MoeB/ThiF family protein [Candidatus Phycosocius spiralis]|uniref:Thiamine biosynthesis protein ThiF n=1 Tax=Candidatus Phycosocius spiralis TaxID=2815099 RepID=A0ABQ4PT63_9PROT|nr:HesA/MoeB/ThiF family protein [Candidatus Phycosocius spiralis]GIU66187.1 thiamine biosynthesis protein ThiF [Candidatus Phycosocius spiralis]